ncbi:MAG: hypothetical protein KTR29_15960 [Rhodothermaceae bacterium]|nr:hypothetical protein [Rhodothermaceae bacterium]
MDLQEVEVTNARVLRVWWEYLWRTILVTIGSMVVAGLVGGIIGFGLGIFMTMGGYQQDEIQAVARPVGMVLGGVIGLVFSIIPMKLILGKSFGDFRLVLVKNSKKEPEDKHEAV